MSDGSQQHPQRFADIFPPDSCYCLRMLNLRRCVVGVVAVLLVALGTIAGCGGDSSTPTAPSPTSPTITGVAVSPSGVGIESATPFTFTVQGVSDPDGESTYVWTSTDGQTVPSTTGTVASFIYERSGVFEMRVTVTNSQGVSASAAKAVTITNLTGVWDLNCVNPNTYYPYMPSLFVVTLAQSNNHAPTYTGDSGTQLSGSITGTSSGLGYVEMRSWTESIGRGGVYSGPGDPRHGQELYPIKRHFSLGVEGYDNPWGAWTEDLLFYLALNETGTLATSFRDIVMCGPVVATLR
mgnify:CR=1 FL=1